jgi:hypothetical protein
MTVHGRPRWMSTSRSSWNSVSLRFTPRLIGAARTAKLLDFRERLAELDANRNPAAALVLAQLAAQQTRADPARWLQEKLALTRRLYDLGYILNRGKLALMRRLCNLTAASEPGGLTIGHRSNEYDKL